MKKRNFLDFFQENFFEKTVVSNSAYKRDKEELEKTIRKSDILNNPLILAETYKNFILEKDRYSSNTKDVLALNHWIYEPKDERIIIEEIFHMFFSQESEIFALKNDPKYEFPIFEMKGKCEISHLSPLTLENVLEEFIIMANSIQEIEFLIRDMRGILKGRVFEGFINKVEQIKNEFIENIGNLQLIFLFHSFKSNFFNIYDFFFFFLNQLNLVKRKEIKKSLKNEFISKINIPITLLDLRNCLSEEAERSVFFLLKVLKKIKAGIYRIKYHFNGENMTAILVSELLDYLYQLLDEEFMEKTTPYFRLIIELFIETFKNYYSFIVDWFRNGLFKDPNGEFMIKSNKKNEVSIESKIEWFKDFEIRKMVLYE